MQIRKRLGAALGIFIISAGGAVADEPPCGAQVPRAEPPCSAQVPTVEVEVRSGDGRVTIPFEVKNNHVIIPISIAGSELDVILDTGMPSEGLMLFGTREVEELGLDYGPVKALVKGAGGEEKPHEARVASGVTIDIEDLRLRNATTIVAPPLDHFVNYHDGVIGASLFNNFVVDINYDRGLIELLDPETYTPPEDAVALPLTFENNTPYTKVTVTTADGRKVPLTVVVDLGASHGISLNVDRTDEIDVPAKAVHTVIGRGVSGEVRGQVGRLRGLELGGIALSDVVATFPSGDHQICGGAESSSGNLGDGVLKRFNVTFDYAHERMLLLPNEQFGEPFEWNMSGMQLGPGDGAAPRIESIIAGSPAERAGLAVGDVVTHVNGRAVSNEDIIELREQMKQEGEVLMIAARRGGKPIEVKLKLRRLV